MGVPQQLKNGSALGFLKDYWFIVVFIISFAMVWSEMRAEVQANTIINAKQSVSIDNNHEELEALQLQYAQDVSVIKATLQAKLPD